MLILGIDPGYAITGYGVIEKKPNSLALIDCGAITTSAKMPFPERLKIIAEGIEAVLLKYSPKAAAIESLFFSKNAKTAIAVGEARGVALFTLAKKNLPIYEYTPLQVKQAVASYGKADKNQVQQMVKILLSLKEIPRPDDAADALAIAICCANSVRI